MKTIKTFLAWLDWSTYCQDGHGYDFPRTLCGLFWRTVFSILVFPIMFLGHLWNLTYIKRMFYADTWKGATAKLQIWLTTGIEFAMLLSAFFSDQILYKYWGINIILRSDGFWNIILKSIPLGLAGIIVAVIVVAVVLGSIYGIVQAFIYMFSVKTETGNSIKSAVSDTYSAIKDNYCPIIDWDINK